jgi:hypothetical protein
MVFVERLLSIEQVYFGVYMTIFSVNQIYYELNVCMFSVKQEYFGVMCVYLV